jgi:iron-sulfur cluster assembly protein
MITMTDTAADKVRFFAKEMPEAAGRELRIFVQSGGCSGVAYGFTFDEQQSDDTVVESAGIKVLVDPASAKLLEGANVDYVTDERGEGFVVDNPNVQNNCGGCSCGH